MDFLEHDLKTLQEDMAEPFLPSETKTLLFQLTSAVEYLHSNWILHRDLKTSNLLMNNRGQIKIADFGMARYYGDPPPKLTQLVVTLWYRAPELLLGADKYGPEIDMWSVGCIFGELLTKEPLLQGKNEVDELSKVGLPHAYQSSTYTCTDIRALRDPYRGELAGLQTFAECSVVAPTSYAAERRSRHPSQIPSPYRGRHRPSSLLAFVEPS